MILKDSNDQAVWDDFFNTMVGWTYHPGYYRENATKPTFKECAVMTDEMMKVRAEHLREKLTP